nr:MAG TPA: hypothetical protein [Caudoviricetes sp.]
MLFYFVSTLGVKLVLLCIKSRVNFFGIFSLGVILFFGIYTLLVLLF